MCIFSLKFNVTVNLKSQFKNININLYIWFAYQITLFNLNLTITCV